MDFSTLAVDTSVDLPLMHLTNLKKVEKTVLVELTDEQVKAFLLSSRKKDLILMSRPRLLRCNLRSVAMPSDLQRGKQSQRTFLAITANTLINGNLLVSMREQKRWVGGTRGCLLMRSGPAQDSDEDA
jgi:hypothetical protein